MHVLVRHLSFVASIVTVPLALGCQGSPADEEDLRAASDEPEQLGAIQAELTKVPTGVSCVTISASGETSVAKSFEVRAGAASTLNMGLLPLGSVTITATAYDVACDEMTASTTASWVSEPVTTVLRAGNTAVIAIVLRRATTTNVGVDFEEVPIAIANGGAATYAVTSDGSAWAWGSNDAGQLGDGTRTRRLTPQKIPSLAGVLQIAGGESHACALLAEGTVKCWGENSSGQLGDGTGSDRLTPVTVLSLSSVVQLRARGSHTCAMRSNGNIKCWGANSQGQLGDGTTTSRPAPVSAEFTGPNRGIELAVGTQHSCAIDERADVYCWGSNSHLQVGASEQTEQVVTYNGLLPHLVGGSQKLVASDGATCALRGDSKVLCWGSSWYGELGGDDIHNRRYPRTIADPGGPIVDLAAGASHMCGLRDDGVALCWGADLDGQTGQGRGGDGFSYEPSEVLGLTNAVALSAGGSTSCALTADADILCWGNNRSGQVGDGTRANRFVATPVVW